MKQRLYLTILLMLSFNSQAETIPENSAADSRIRKVVYQPDQVVVIQAYYYVATLIQLAPDEVIDPEYPFLLGDPTAWDLNIFGSNAFYVKPIKEKPNTNLTVRTNKRTYFFALQSSYIKSALSNLANYAVIFDYPDIERNQYLVKQLAAQHHKEYTPLPTEVVPVTASPVTRQPTTIHLDYRISGNKQISPKHVYDQDNKVYFQFYENRLIPAIYAIRGGQPTLVNYRTDGNFIVIDGLAPAFELRHEKKRAKVVRKEF